MQFIYLSALMFSLAGLYFADRKYKLVLFPYSKYSVYPIVIGIVFFLVWDLAGIVSDVFSTNREWVSGLYFATPDLPIEEFLFLALLCYITLIIWSLVCSRTS